jgi:hypothetical protein
MIHDQIISRLYTTLINLSSMAYKERTKQKRERERRSSYCHYSSSTLLAGLRATDGGTLDNRDSESQWVWVQRVSISSFIRSVLY